MKKTQKFGIRKHKFGAASVLLGIMVFIGIGHHHEAEAAEDVRKQNTIGNRNEDNSEIDENTAEQVNIEQEQNQDLKLQAENQQSQSEKQTEVNAVSAQPFKAEAQEQVPSNTTVEASERKSEEVGEGKPATQNQTTAPQSLTAPTTAKSAETQTSTSPQVRATTYNNTQQGQDVTNKVEVVNSSITGKDQNKTVNPHNAERLTLNYELKFKEGIKVGDYFDFKLSDNVDTHGVSIVRKVPVIKDANEQTIAIGQIIGEGHVRYHFSDYVINKSDLNANLSINLFINPQKVKYSGVQKVSSTLGDKETSDSFNILYLEGVKDSKNVNVNGRIYEIDKDKTTFKHLAYINQYKKNIQAGTIYGKITVGSPELNKQPIIKVYKYKGTEKIAESVYADFSDQSNFEDVTSKVSLNIYNNGDYTLQIPNIGNDTYLIDYESHFKSMNSDLNFRTILSGYNNYNYYYYTNKSLTWDNGVAFYSNNAKGSGKDKPVEPLIEQSLPIIIDMNTSPEPERYEAKGVLEESEDSKPIVFESQSGQDFGDGGYDYTETVEDSNPIEISESTHEKSEHHSDVVEFEEETNPGGSESQHESNVVEYDEDTAKGIVTGAVTDHTTVEDTKEYTTENNLVELEDTLNPNVSGQAEGPIEEITENDDYNEMSGLGLEGGDSGYTKTEEIDENHFIDTNSQLGTENGTNSDNQTFEEDTEDDKPVYQIGSSQEIVEDTTLASESGMNSGNQTFEEDTNEDKPVYQIGSSQEIVEDTTLPNESGMNSDNQTFEEDTEEDKDVIQQGGHSPVDITEDTQPQISGQHQGEQTFEEDTVTPDQPQPPVDREFTPQDNVPPMPPTDEEISPKDPEMLTPPVNEETQPNQPESPTPQEDKEINPNQPHPSSPPMENITANDPKTPVAPKDSETVPSVSKQTTMTSGQAKKTNQSEAMVQTENQKSQINQAEDAKENQHSTTDEKALPITGQGRANQTPVVLGTMIGAFGLLLLRRRKNNHHTK